jgi:hypothetical protein
LALAAATATKSPTGRNPKIDERAALFGILRLLDD